METSKILFEKARELLQQSQRILLVGHVRPDGDTLGSSLALASAMEQWGKEVTCICYDEPAEVYDFLPGIKRFELRIPPKQFDLVVTVDCGDLERMTGFYQDRPDFFEKTPLLNIDHHASNSRFGTHAVVVPQMASVGQIMYYFLQYLRVELTTDMATQLLTALHFDTGSFQHSNTTPEVMRIASNLMHARADNKSITKAFYQHRKISMLRLWGRALNNLQLDEQRNMVSLFISQQDLNDTKTTADDAEGLANLIQGIPEANMAVVMMERENGEVKTSIRTSDEQDAAYYASQFGGGGHHKAAGFSVPLRKSH